MPAQPPDRVARHDPRRRLPGPYDRPAVGKPLHVGNLDRVAGQEVHALGAFGGQVAVALPNDVDRPTGVGAAIGSIEDPREGDRDPRTAVEAVGIADDAPVEAYDLTAGQPDPQRAPGAMDRDRRRGGQNAGRRDREQQTLRQATRYVGPAVAVTAERENDRDHHRQQHDHEPPRLRRNDKDQGRGDHARGGQQRRRAGERRRDRTTNR